MTMQNYTKYIFIYNNMRVFENNNKSFDMGMLYDKSLSVQFDFIENDNKCTLFFYLEDYTSESEWLFYYDKKEQFVKFDITIYNTLNIDIDFAIYIYDFNFVYKDIFGIKS